MSLTQQKALLLRSMGGPYEVGSFPVSSPAPDQVLVKVLSAALNPLDVIMQSSGFLVEAYPTITGSDAAGVIESVGDGVSGFQKGDRVYVSFRFDATVRSLMSSSLFQSVFTPTRGTFQQYVLTDAPCTAKVSFDMHSSIRSWCIRPTDSRQLVF